MTSEDKNIVYDFITLETGMTLPESNQTSFLRFLDNRLLEKSLDLSKYLNSLKSDSKEYEIFMDEMTINETYFFREENHFRFIQNEIIPSLDKNRKLYCWSASCSSGEEPLSLFALFNRNGMTNEQYSITASDISNIILNKFRQGVYRKTTLRKDGQDFHQFISGISTQKDEHNFSINSKTLENIDIKNLNVFTDDLSKLPIMDIIFFRNTLIYMNQAIKDRVIDRLVKHLRPGGHLLLSVSEIPLISHPQLSIKEYKNCFALIKKNPEDFDSEKIRNTWKKKAPIHIPQKKDIQIKILVTPELISNYKVDELSVCRRICQKLNNRVSIPTSNEIEKQALFFLDILSNIEEKEYDKTVEKIKSREGEIEPLSLYFHFLGYIYYTLGNKNIAAVNFEKALKENPRFWPARYYLAVSISKQNLKSVYSSLEMTLNDIKEYIKGNRNDYQFLLEGFNAKYFQLICENKVKKIIQNNRSSENAYQQRSLY